MVWYYFSNSGKIITDGWSKIDNKYYYFDSDGVMQTGWVDDDTYYTGSDGAMRTGWQYLQDPEDKDSFDDKTVPFEDDEGQALVLFPKLRQEVCAEYQQRDYKLYKIDGVYYCFSETGAMQTGWVNMGIRPMEALKITAFSRRNGKSADRVVLVNSAGR